MRKFILSLSILSVAVLRSESGWSQTSGGDPYCEGWQGNLEETTQGTFQICESWAYGTEENDYPFGFTEYGDGHFLVGGNAGFMNASAHILILITPSGSPKSYKIFPVEGPSTNIEDVAPFGQDHMIVTGNYKEREVDILKDWLSMEPEEIANGVMFSRLDDQGNLQTPTMLEKSSNMMTRHIFTVDDDEFLILARDRVFGGDFYILLINSEGEVKKKRRHRNSLIGPARNAAQAKDGKVYALGWDREIGGRQKMTLTTIKTNGKISKEIQFEDLDFAAASDMAVDDEHIWITGARDIGEYKFDLDLWIGKLSHKSEIIWKKIIASPDNIEGTAILPHKGGVLIASEENRGKYVLLEQFDQDGTKIWTMTYKLEEPLKIEDMIMTDDGALLIVGHTRYSRDGTEDILIMRLK